MNSIKVKSGRDGFEVEIQTDEPQTPKQMADAMIDVFKAAPPPRITHVIDVKGHAALPAPDERIDGQASEPDARTSPRKRKTGAKNSRDPVANEPTAEDRIEELIAASKFESPQELNQVQLELERKALHYSRPHIANALAALVRKGRLDRIGTKRDYKYVRTDIQSEQAVDPSAVRSGAVESTATGELVKATTDQTLDAALAQAQQ